MKVNNKSTRIFKLYCSFVHKPFFFVCEIKHLFSDNNNNNNNNHSNNFIDNSNENNLFTYLKNKIDKNKNIFIHKF